MVQIPLLLDRFGRLVFSPPGNRQHRAVTQIQASLPTTEYRNQLRLVLVTGTRTSVRDTNWRAPGPAHVMQTFP